MKFKGLVVFLVVMAVMIGWLGTVQADIKPIAVPSLEGMVPFSQSTRYMSITGYIRWQHYLGNDEWLQPFTEQTHYMSLNGLFRWGNFVEHGVWVNPKTGQLYP